MEKEKKNEPRLMKVMSDDATYIVIWTLIQVSLFKKSYVECYFLKPVIASDADLVLQGKSRSYLQTLA